MNTYMDNLKERLMDHSIDEALLHQILDSYQQRVEENDETLCSVELEVEKLITKYDLKLIENNNQDVSAMIALYPLISLISYFILGFGFDLWNPGWMIFIFIPILMLVFSVFHDDFVAGIQALIPFLIILSYFLIGFYVHIWHPTWLVFMLMPVIGIFSANRSRNIKYFLYAISPIIVMSIYLILGLYFHLWNSVWAIFILVPMIACLQEDNKKRLLVCEISLFVAMVVGFVIPQITPLWGYSFFGLIIPSVAFISLGEDALIKFSKDTMKDWMVFVVIAFIYLGLGLLFDAWAYAWMIYLLFIIYIIYNQSTEHFKFYYIMPFISIAIFFSLGYFFGLWGFGLLAILLPVISFFVERD